MVESAFWGWEGQVVQRLCNLVGGLRSTHPELVQADALAVDE